MLVERYVNLLRAGVAPENILAITFTLKAAAEMRQRIIERHARGQPVVAADATLWRDLRDRLGDIDFDDRRFACRSSVSFRSRQTSIRASTWRRTPTCRG